MEKPHFYLAVDNGMSMSFGITVYIGNDKNFPIFSGYTGGEDHDSRIDLFRSFVNAENAGLLTFSFDIYHEDGYINMRWMGESGGGKNLSRQDCRNWIWDLNGMRIERGKKDSPSNSCCRVITDTKQRDKIFNR